MPQTTRNNAEQLNNAGVMMVTNNKFVGTVTNNEFVIIFKNYFEKLHYFSRHSVDCLI